MLDAYEVVTEVDLQPEDGEFFAFNYLDYEVAPGLTFSAAHSGHADYKWAQSLFPEGREQQCMECGHVIRNAVIMCKPDGSYCVVGQDCAQRLASGYTRKEWTPFVIARDSRKINTSRGVRYVYSFPADERFWSFPKERRPDYVSVRKNCYRTGYGKSSREHEEWQVSIWAEQKGDLVQWVMAFREMLNVKVEAIA